MISYLQTCNINLVFLSFVYSSTNQCKTGKSYTSVVHGLHTSQLLLCPTKMWFVHKCSSAPSSLFQKVAFWQPSIAKWLPEKEIQSPQKHLEGEDTLWHITQMANAPNGTFSPLRFATAGERERRDCLVAKTIYFNITKLLRPGNIANGAQNPSESIKFAILSRSSF